MKHSITSSAFRLIAMGVVVIAAQGCTVLPSFNEPNYVAPFDGAEVIENTTRYTKALQCLAPRLRAIERNRFAVGSIKDFTGKEDLVNGKRLTQGAALMVISALGQAGVPLVERFDTSITGMELKYADNKLITDTPEAGNGAYRRLFSGSIPGSDYYLIGGITEVNYNIRSGALDSSIKFVSTGARYFVMSIGVDLRLVNTKTLEVANIQSLQKQIIGTELRGGFVRLFDSGLVDISSSERTQEPIQRGVRMVLEQAVFNMLSEVYGLNGNACLGHTKLSTPSEVGSQAKMESTSPPTVTKTTEPALPKAAPTQSISQPVGSFSAQAPRENGTTPENVPPELAGPTGATTLPPRGATTLPPLATRTETPVLAEQPYNSDPEQNTLQGLVGISPKVNEDVESPTSLSDNEMKEKLLWGSTPFIR